MTNEYTITIRAPVMPNPVDIALYLQAEVLGINKVRQTQGNKQSIKSYTYDILA